MGNLTMTNTDWDIEPRADTKKFISMLEEDELFYFMTFLQINYPDSSANMLAHRAHRKMVKLDTLDERDDYAERIENALKELG